MKRIFIPLLLTGSIFLVSCSAKHKENDGADAQQVQAVAFAFGPPGWVVGTVLTVVSVGGIVYNVYQYNPKKATPTGNITGNFRSSGLAKNAAKKAALKASQRAAAASTMSDDDRNNNWYLVHVLKSGQEGTLYKYVGPGALSRCELDAWDLNQLETSPYHLRYECRPTQGDDPNPNYKPTIRGPGRLPDLEP